ncbi:hypothetical protein ABT034_06205 [Streptomyces sp. NPDC002773]|uniref:hypothetical protein n=1 Tax=Streptomyces sp. NPDC002773 TaxID=3154430 RepID=UPI00331E9FA1
MGAAGRFDQRAVALIELRCTRPEADLFEAALEERGWPVLERRGAALSESSERPVWYVIEARFPGSRVNAARGARERIELVADDLLLDLHVEAVESVVRDPADRPHWFAYERPEVHARTVPDLPRRTRWAERVRLWLAENTGIRDTGRLITAASAGAAEHLASRPLPGAPRRSGRLAARRPMGASPRPRPPAGGRRESSALFVRLAVLLSIGMWAGARITDGRAQGIGAWGWAALVAIGVTWGMARVGRRLLPEGSDTAAYGLGVVFGLAALGIGAGTALTAPDAGRGSAVLFVALCAAVVGNGLRLLVRQWTWQRAAPWLIPALLPLAFGFLPGLGLSVHVMYLEQFGVDLEDIEIPKAYQFLALLKLTACMSLWFMAPSLLGYMKHFHWHVKDRWFGHAVLLVVSVALLVNGVLGLGLLAAGEAGAKAVRDAVQGRTPAAYYGVEPEWVCVRPVGKTTDIPVDGGVLDPSRSYVRIGDAGGTVVLWAPDGNEVLKVPLSRLGIIPSEGRPAPSSCAAGGAGNR